jgi:hypothetical protein
LVFISLFGFCFERKMNAAVDTSKVPKPTNGVKPQKDKRKKKKKKSRAEKKRAQASTLPKLEVKEEEQVEIEYVAANPLEDLDPNDPAFQEFAGVFQRFNPEQNDEELMEEDNERGRASGNRVRGSQSSGRT